MLLLEGCDVNPRFMEQTQPLFCLLVCRVAVTLIELARTPADSAPCLTLPSLPLGLLRSADSPYFREELFSAVLLLRRVGGRGCLGLGCLTPVCAMIRLFALIVFVASSNSMYGPRCSPSASCCFHFVGDGSFDNEDHPRLHWLNVLVPQRFHPCNQFLRLLALDCVFLSSSTASAFP